MNAKLRASLAGLFVLAVAGFTLLLVRPGLDPARLRPLPLIVGAWIAFAAAVWLLRKVGIRTAVPLIIIGGIAIQAAALSAPPQESSDLYRYMWDGKVQAAGIDPYLYAPADAGVVKLRNDFLWSPNGPHHYVDCVASTTDPAHPADRLIEGCTKLNRPKVPTIYPPVAEAYFFGVHLVAPGTDSTTPIQAAAVACALLTTLILLYGLRLFRRDLRLAALWAWCPLVALEAGNSAHVDALAVALTAIALLVLARSRTEGKTMLGGVLLGLAVATKVTPLLIVPAVLRRGWFLIASSAAAAIGLVYAPHALAVGRKIVGFMPGYLDQQGYSNGKGFNVIDLVLQGKAAILAAAVVLGVITLGVLRYSNPDQPWRGAVVMTGSALAVSTPHYQWYALLLVMLVALDGRAEWLALAAAGYLPAEPELPHLGPFILWRYQAAELGYGAAIVFILAVTALRFWYARRTSTQAGQSAATGGAPWPPAPEPSTVGAASTIEAASTVEAPSATAQASPTRRTAGKAAVKQPGAGPGSTADEASGADEPARATESV